MVFLVVGKKIKGSGRVETFGVCTGLAGFDSRDR